MYVVEMRSLMGDLFPRGLRVLHTADGIYAMRFEEHADDASVTAWRADESGMMRKLHVSTTAVMHQMIPGLIQREMARRCIAELVPEQQAVAAMIQQVYWGWHL